MTSTLLPAPRRRTRVIGLAGIALVLVAATACSGSGSTAPDTDLGRALEQVHSQGADVMVEFGRPRATVIANDGEMTGNGPYGRVLGYGTSSLAALSSLTPKVLGFNALTAEYAVTAGQLPKSGTLLSGIDTTRVKAHVVALGAKADGTTYRLRPDYRQVTDDKLAKAFGNTGVGLGINVIGIDSDDLRIASAAAGIDLTSGAKSTLASNTAITSVADCLQDPLGAEITSKVPAGTRRPTGSDPKKTIGVDALGVGVSGSKGAIPVEHLCISADSGDHASTIAASIRSALAKDYSVQSQMKWSSLLKDGKVEVSGSVVSLSAQPANGIGGVLLDGFLRGDLPGLAG